MALADFQPETETIVIAKARGNRPETTVTVRGLSFNDISKLVRVHYSDLDGLFDMYELAGGQDLTAIATGKFALRLVNDAPGLVAHIIALAADEEDQLETVTMLPLTVQLEAIRKIATLTFSDVEQLKKALAQVMGLVGDMKAGQSANA